MTSSDIDRKKISFPEVGRRKTQNRGRNAVWRASLFLEPDMVEASCVTLGIGDLGVESLLGVVCLPWGLVLAAWGCGRCSFTDIQYYRKGILWHELTGRRDWSFTLC